MSYRQLVLFQTILVSVATAVFSIKMLFWPWRTAEPSLINCFNYLPPFEATLMYSAGVVLAGSILALALMGRKSVCVFVEALLVLSVAYLILVNTYSAPYVVGGGSIAPALTWIGGIGSVYLLFLRHEIFRVFEAEED